MWAAQQAFDTACSGGLDVNQYCSTAAETCCGLCNVVPISGPGTILANILGTLLNMVFALRFRSETPYTLFFQMLGTDFAVISLVDRAFQGKNRMSLWHYCMVPLSACSVVPIIVACSLSRLKYMHNLSTVAAVKLSYGQMPLIAEAPIPSELLESPADRRSHSAHSLSKALKKRDSHYRPRAHRRSPSVESADPSTYRQLNQYLARTVLWATLVHILVYAGTFIGVFGFIDNTWQSSCIEKYGLNQWRLAMGIFAGVMLVIALLFWFCLYKAMDVKFRKRKRLVDGLEMFIAASCALFHLSTLRNYVMPRDRYWLQKRRKETFRWSISFAVYLMWACPYAVIYVKAGNDFILPGLNPWPYEQVAGAVGLLTPICIVARAFVNERDGYDGKNKTIEDTRIARAQWVSDQAEAKRARSHVSPPHQKQEQSAESPARRTSARPTTRSPVRRRRSSTSPAPAEHMMSGALGEDEVPYESPRTSAAGGHGLFGRRPRHDTQPSSERDEERRRHRLQLQHGRSHARVSSLGDDLVPAPLFSPRNGSPSSPVSPPADPAERTDLRRSTSARPTSRDRAAPDDSEHARE